MRPASIPGEVPGEICYSPEEPPESDPPLPNLETEVTDEKREEYSETESKPFPNLTKLPRLEIRRVFMADIKEDAWAVTTEIVLRERESGDFDTEYAVLHIFTGEEGDCKKRAEAFKYGYLKGLARVLK